MKKVKTQRSETFSWKLKRDLRKNWSLYILIIPVLVFYILFCYKPMYGAIIAFKNYKPNLGIMGSELVGLKHFRDFLGNPYFGRILKNTLIISFGTLLFSFPAPIILALMLNELRGKWFPRVVQTCSYLPHFISLVVICSLIKEFTASNGVINDFLVLFGIPRETMLNNPKLFVPIYIISDIWAGIGWGSIIYMAALTGVDQSLYEAAEMDGAGRWRQTLTVTLPCIAPTIITMLILRIGSLMNVGYEKIILLYNPATYKTADVISSFVYRKGLIERGYSYSTAVGLFNSVINCVLLFLSNQFSKKINGTSLW